MNPLQSYLTTVVLLASGQSSNATVLNLMRKAEVETLPSVIVLDPQGNIVSKEGYTNMAFFPGKWVGRDN